MLNMMIENTTLRAKNNTVMVCDRICSQFAAESAKPYFMYGEAFEARNAGKDGASLTVLFFVVSITAARQLGVGKIASMRPAIEAEKIKSIAGYALFLRR